MRIRILTSLIICISQNAYAGAWAREKGELFIAAGGNFLLSSGAQLPVHYDPTLYAEFGATERLTFGLDLHTADKGRIGTVFIFTNFPIGDTEAQNRYSAGFALGARADAYHATETLLRGHVSWGRGIEDGWLAVDASATYGTRDRTFRPKVDATWGQSWSDNWTTILQLQTGQGFTDDYYAKIAPSIVYEWSDKMNFQLGLVQGLTGDKGAGLKFETWLTY